MVFAQKKIFKNKNQDIHIGINMPEGFSEANILDVIELLENLKGKRLWRCFVCNDVHIAKEPLEICSTCLQKYAYVEINKKELKNLLEIK